MAEELRGLHLPCPTRGQGIPLTVISIHDHVPERETIGDVVLRLSTADSLSKWPTRVVSFDEGVELRR